MARDGTGQYNLPAGPVVNATAIDPNDENSTRADIATALTGSLARDGQGGMTGPLSMGGNAILNGGAGTFTSVTGTAAIFTSMNGGALAGFRNIIINGNPTVNQRAYVSGTNTSAANQFTLDRWFVLTSGQAVSWTDSAGIRTVTAPAGGMATVIEGGGMLGGVHTLNWTGTATALVNGNAVAKGAQVTLTGGTNTTVRMSNGTWAQLQLEPGTQATPFERRPIGAELMLCQRYLFRMDIPSTASPLNEAYLPGMIEGSGANYSVAFPVQMRASPAFATSGASGFQYHVSGVANGVASSIAAQGIRNHGGKIVIGCTFSGTVGLACQLCPIANTATFLQFDAELTA